MRRQERVATRHGKVDVVTLENEHCRLVTTSLGARVVELDVPDARGAWADVALGRSDVDAYWDDPYYLGATAGRYANRIREGHLPLADHVHQLSINDGRHHLHGGARGFDARAWETAPGDEDAVTFTLTSPDGDEGYPGTVEVAVTYVLVGSALDITMTATTDQLTVVNLVNHVYLNLAGHDAGSVLDHELQIVAERYTPVDDELIPTGAIEPVASTRFDFRQPTTIGRHLDSTSGTTIDHNWVLDGDGWRTAAKLSAPSSGRSMVLETDQPGLQVFIPPTLPGVDPPGDVDAYGPFPGIAFEAQTFPDAVHHPGFPQRVLRPGERYRSRTRLTFGTSSS